MMINFTFRLQPILLKRLRAKAGTIPASAVIRRLIEKFIAGEVGLD